MNRKRQRGFFDPGPAWLWMVMPILALIGVGFIVWEIVAWLAEHVRFV